MIIIKKIGRNEICPCGSGKKYKNCCIRKEKSIKVSPKDKNNKVETLKPRIVELGEDYNSQKESEEDEIEKE